MARITEHDAGAGIAARYGVHRSPRWTEIARAHLEKHPVCVACVHAAAHVAVHHIFPFHFCVQLGRADLELDERNLLTLCEPEHHLLVGHFDDYESMNLRARREAERDFHGMSAAQIRANEHWRALAAARPPHLDAMSEEARRKLRSVMDDRMPA